MEDNKNQRDQTNPKKEQPQDDPTLETKSDSDFYRRTMTGTGAQKSDENFDGLSRQGNEKDLEDRDNNDGDANTENNY